MYEPPARYFVNSLVVGTRVPRFSYTPGALPQNRSSARALSAHRGTEVTKRATRVCIGGAVARVLDLAPAGLANLRFPRNAPSPLSPGQDN
jgi:hypothetical protein